MDKEQFGKFVASIRKEKGMTQKELGEKLNLTDKAISKWERGLSFPDICILEDLAEALDVSIIELLNGRKSDDKKSLSVSEVNEILDYSLKISDDEIARKREKSRMIIVLCVLIILLCVSVLLNIINYSKLQEVNVETGYEKDLEEDGNEER